MMTLRLFAALALPLCLAACSNPPAKPEPAPTVAPATLTALPEWAARVHVPAVAVAKIEDGKVAWTHVIGERAPGARASRATVFNVASLTKPVFALMTLRLVAAGTLDLDAPLAADWVDPDLADDARRDALTTRLALSHQTGLPNWRGDAALAFEFDPGTRHEYSGEGYEYLRRALERRTGRGVDALLREHVLEPAGMTDTSFGWNDAVAATLASGHDEAGAAYDMDYLEDREPAAASSMLTTIDDYARFVAWVARGAGLPPAVFDDMRRAQAQHADPAEHFGLGWRLVEVGGETVLAHDGREDGVRTQVYVFPESREGLVVLTNGNHGELVVRAVAAATLARGPELLDAIDRDTWTYLAKLPSAALPRIANVIVRSPSFMSKLMHAADATLVANAGLPEDERAAARDAIDPFAQAMVDGARGERDAQRVFDVLIDAQGGAPRLHGAFDTDRARSWASTLMP